MPSLDVSKAFKLLGFNDKQIYSRCKDFGAEIQGVGEGVLRRCSGAVATEYKFTKIFNAFVSVGYDTDHLFNIRPGFNFEF